MGKIKSLVKKIGRNWLSFSDDTRKVLSGFFEKLAVASIIPVLITPLVTGVVTSVWRLLLLFLCGIIFLVVSILVIAKKEKK